MTKSHFTLSDTTPPESSDLPTSRSRLPDSLGDAQSILDTQVEQSQLATDDLREVQRRLSQLGVGGSEGPSLPAAPASSGLRQRADTEQRETIRQLQAFLEQAEQMLMRSTNIETKKAGTFIGRTTINQAGDFTTLWAANITPQLMRLHCQSVRLALASRIKWLRAMNIVGTGMINLARQTATSGSVLLLPALWKFVRDTLAELRRSHPQF